MKGVDLTKDVTSHLQGLLTVFQMQSKLGKKFTTEQLEELEVNLEVFLKLVKEQRK